MTIGIVISQGYGHTINIGYPTIDTLACAVGHTTITCISKVDIRRRSTLIGDAVVGTILIQFRLNAIQAILSVTMGMVMTPQENHIGATLEGIDNTLGISDGSAAVPVQREVRHHKDRLIGGSSFQIVLQRIYLFR